MKNTYEAMNDWYMPEEDQRLNETSEKEFVLSKAIEDLQKINKKLAKLMIEKEELTNQLISAFDHNHEGQKTYEYHTWKVEIKTPVVYSLDKKLYEEGDVDLPENYNPIKSCISYTVDKKLFEKYMSTCSNDIKEKLIALIEKKPGKVGIVIKERV